MTKRHSTQAGLSLVELMISMALASIIATAAIAMLVSDAQTSRFQVGRVTAHTSGKFAFDFILADLRRAGYIEHATVPSAVTGRNSDTLGDGDVLNIHYDSALADNRDCVGNPIVDADPAKRQVVNTYQIEEIDGENVLTCNDSPLLNDVEGFHVLWGIDQNGDEVPDRYVKPGSMVAGDRLVTVQVALLVATREESGEYLSRTFQLLDSAPQTFTDKRSRILFSATERIRNINMDEVL